MRSFTLPGLKDDKGKTVINATCKAFSAATHLLVETQYTDSNGQATFTALPDNVDCNIVAMWGGNSQWFFSEAPPDLSEIPGDLDDIDDGTTYGRVVLDQLTVNRITLGGADGDLDDISDGTYGKVLSTSISAGKILLDETTAGTYGKVLSTHIDAGKIKISSATTYATNYDPSSKKKVFTATPTTPYYVGDLWVDDSNIRRCITQRVTGSYTSDDWIQTTLDAIKDGTTYGRVKSTSIYAGNIKLTSNTVVDGEWYNESGVEIDATHGINIYGTDSALTTRATKTGTIQCKVDSNGKIVAGAGTVLLDSSGITIKGKTLILQDPDGTNRGYVAGYNTGGTTRLYVEATHDLYLVTGASSNLYISAANIKDCPSIEPGGGVLCGKTTAYWTDMTTVVLTLSETTTPTAVTNFGKLYTKTDDKLYFQNGAGVEKEVAFV